MTRRGYTLTPRQRLAFCTALRELWTSAPHLTVGHVCERTGAPRPIAQLVRKQLVAKGVLEPHENGRREVGAVITQNARAVRDTARNVVAMFGGGEGES